MRTSLAAATAALLGGIFLSTGASAQCPPLPMPTASSGCGAVITITNTGATVMAVGSPYDFGGDDIYVGVVNNITACTSNKSTSACGISIYSIDLSSGTTICGFDGDGIDYYGAPGNGMDSTGYGGPNAYFTNINAGATACRVNFITPIPPGGTSYFSLENALSTASPCTTALNNSVAVTTVGGQQMQATFTPQGGYNIATALSICNFTLFDWQQTVTNLPAPSPFASGCLVGGMPVPLTAPPSFNDPLAVCGYAPGYGSQAPYGLNVYWNPFNAELPSATTATTLTIADAPADRCLPGAQSAAVAAQANLPFINPTGQAGCGAGGGVRAPAGSVIAFTTHLVGLTGLGPGYGIVDTGVGFTWTSNFNGTSGGTVATKNPNPVDPGSGTGGVTITSTTETSTYTGVGVVAVNGSSNIFAPTTLLSAVLPESRSVQVNATATAFATIINTGSNTATSCSIAPASGVPVTFVYQTTNPSTNAVTGSPNTPVDIPAGASQSFVIALTPTAAIAPGDVGFNFSCTNTSPAAIVTGLNTLLFSASTSPTPDVVALAATLQNDGIVHVTGPPTSQGGSPTGVFAVATINLGSGDTITVSTNTGEATLPITVTICQTNPTTGVCLQTPGLTVATTISANAEPTFGIFVSASGTVAFDPTNNRIFVQFTDSTGAVRGETSVAVETQ